jgi:hypothetical protein
MKVLQVEENRLRELVETENARVSTTASASLSWGEFRRLMPGRLMEPDFRAKLKSAMRTMVDKVVVELGTNTYEVFLKGYTHPIKAKLEDGSVYYNFEDKQGVRSVGCCAPLSLRWPELRSVTKKLQSKMFTKL